MLAAQTEEPHTEALAISRTPALQPRERFPIVYISYRVWVPHYVMFPKATRVVGANIRHVEAASDDSVAASLPPFEVPFLAMTTQEFKRGVIAALGASRTDFPLSNVLTAADESRKLQWRGNISWPGGPQTDNFDVSLTYKAFGEHVAQAVLPKRCRLQLVMENPLRRIADPYYVSPVCEV
jgi:hypothetical protein